MAATQTSAGERRRSYEGPAIFSHGFRPFFLFGALYAGLAVPLWLAALVSGVELRGAITAVDWHIHEMTFGYLAAIIAGFILTAVPNWTGRLPVMGLPLATLFLVWVAGRIAVAVAPSLWIVLCVDASFLVILCAVVWREVIAGRNWRNLPVCVLITLFALANILFHLGLRFDGPSGYGTRLALGVAALLIGMIGGRITPSFTRNWMARLNVKPLPAPFGRFDQFTLMCAGTGIVSWIVAPDASFTGYAVLLAGALHVVRLFRWHGELTLREPIVAILHLGYAWLALAFVLIGAAILWPSTIEMSAALHALTAGAIGTMTLAVMTRASLGHTGRAIAANNSILAIYALVTFGAILRVGATLMPFPYEHTLLAGGFAWAAAFLLFFLSYAPILLGERST